MKLSLPKLRQKKSPKGKAKGTKPNKDRQTSGMAGSGMRSTRSNPFRRAADGKPGSARVARLRPTTRKDRFDKQLTEQLAAIPSGRLSRAVVGRIIGLGSFRPGQVNRYLAVSDAGVFEVAMNGHEATIYEHADPGTWLARMESVARSKVSRELGDKAELIDVTVYERPSYLQATGEHLVEFHYREGDRTAIARVNSAGEYLAHIETRP